MWSYNTGELLRRFDCILTGRRYSMYGCYGETLMEVFHGSCWQRLWNQKVWKIGGDRRGHMLALAAIGWYIKPLRLKQEWAENIWEAGRKGEEGSWGKVAPGYSFHSCWGDEGLIGRGLKITARPVYISSSSWTQRSFYPVIKGSREEFKNRNTSFLQWDFHLYRLIIVM